MSRVAPPALASLGDVSPRPAPSPAVAACLFQTSRAGSVHLVSCRARVEGRGGGTECSLWAPHDRWGPGRQRSGLSLLYTHPVQKPNSLVATPNPSTHRNRNSALRPPHTSQRCCPLRRQPASRRDSCGRTACPGFNIADRGKCTEAARQPCSPSPLQFGRVPAAGISVGAQLRRPPPSVRVPVPQGRNPVQGCRELVVAPIHVPAIRWKTSRDSKVAAGTDV